MLRRLVTGSLCALACALIVGPSRAHADGPTIPVVALHGVVIGADADRLDHAIADAATSGAPLVVVDIDSIGGTPDVIRRIVNSELASSVPIVGWIGAGAHADAGALFIAEAAAVIGVTPTSGLDAAHALDLGSTHFAAVADTTAATALAALATMHGRDSAWVTTTALHGGSITGTDAVRRRVADVSVDGIDALMQRLNATHIGSSTGDIAVVTKGVATQTIQPEGWDSVIKNIARPDAAFALLVVAVLCFGIFIAHPAALIMGIVAAGAGIGAGIGFLNLPTNVTGLVFIGLSFALFVVDIKAATHGGLTAAGAVAMAIGGWRLVDTGTLDAGVSAILVVITVATITAAYGALVPKLVAARRMPWSDPHADLVGRVGTVSERLTPHGYISLNGVLWKATATHSPQPEGARVRVIEVEGLRLVVEPQTAEAAVSR